MALRRHYRQGMVDPQRRAAERVPPARPAGVPRVSAACAYQRTVGPDGRSAGAVLLVETLRGSVVAGESKRRRSEKRRRKNRKMRDGVTAGPCSIIGRAWIEENINENSISTLAFQFRPE